MLLFENKMIYTALNSSHLIKSEQRVSSSLVLKMSNEDSGYSSQSTQSNRIWSFSYMNATMLGIQPVWLGYLPGLSKFLSHFELI